MRATTRRSALALAVLEFLWEAPMHPYGMQRLIKERGKDHVLNIRVRASIYQTIDRLRRAGLIAVEETQRQENRPDRTVYRLTDEGREVAPRWLREAISTPTEEFPEFPAAISFMTGLLPEDARQQLEARGGRLRRELERMEAELKTYARSIPRVFLLEEEYLRDVLRVELRWIQSVVRDLRNGILTWNPEQLRRFAEQYSAGNTSGNEDRSTATRRHAAARRKSRQGSFS